MTQAFFAALVAPMADLLSKLADSNDGPRRKERFRQLAHEMGFEAPWSFDGVITTLEKAPADRRLRKKIERMRAAAKVRNLHGLIGRPLEFAMLWLAEYADNPDVTARICETIRMIVQSVRDAQGKSVRTNGDWSDNACTLLGLLEQRSS